MANIHVSFRSHKSGSKIVDSYKPISSLIPVVDFLSKKMSELILNSPLIDPLPPSSETLLTHVWICAHQDKVEKSLNLPLKIIFQGTNPSLTGNIRIGAHRETFQKLSKTDEKSFVKLKKSYLGKRTILSPDSSPHNSPVCKKKARSYSPLTSLSDLIGNELVWNDFLNDPSNWINLFQDKESVK